jgi:hypothetical protein
MHRYLHHSWVRTCQQFPKQRVQRTHISSTARTFQNCIATELRSKELGTSDTKKTDDGLPIEVALAELEAMMSRNVQSDNEPCQLVPPWQIA